MKRGDFDMLAIFLIVVILFGILIPLAQKAAEAQAHHLNPPPRRDNKQKVADG